MNPELRAQLEKLDVWHMTLAAAAERKKAPSSQTEEEKRLAWNAYYSCEMNRAKGAAGKAGSPEEAPRIHVPECFREIAAQDGIYPQATPAPAKVTPRGSLENWGD